MNKENRKVIKEGILLYNTYLEELLAVADDREYSQYHRKKGMWCTSCLVKLEEIIGFKGKALDDFIVCASSIKLTPEQIDALYELRNQPVFKKIVGEDTLQKRYELEKVLGIQIPSEVGKTVEQVNADWDTCLDRLEELCDENEDVYMQYEKYEQELANIFTYFMSIAKGEQVPFRKMTNEEIKGISEENIESQELKGHGVRK